MSLLDEVVKLRREDSKLSLTDALHKAKLNLGLIKESSKRERRKARNKSK